MRRLILRSGSSPSDALLLTAAVRDLHKSYPGQFVTDVRTPFQELWEHNPWITRLSKQEEVQVLDCSAPPRNLNKDSPYHALFGFIGFINNQLNLHIQLTLLKGDIHLSDSERSWDSQVSEIVGRDIPFWIIVAGGKTDVTIRWWDKHRYQDIVDHFRGKIQFVQIGAERDFHPRLKGVIQLTGNTTLRELVRLMYHAQGVLCPAAFAMHLAAAVETKPGMPRNRACVVIAGGRESSQWAAYPHHQFLHTNGALRCCEDGGCWRSRVVPLHDGNELDSPQNLCIDVVGTMPRCMDTITARQVIKGIELYFAGGCLKYLTNQEASEARKAVILGRRLRWRRSDLTINAFRRAAQAFISSIPDYRPSRYRGRGVVICAGGITYFTCAWICIRMLKYLKCSLPIQVWYLGEQEINNEMLQLFASVGVECVNARQLQGGEPAPIPNGYELKPYSIIHSPFKEVLFLEADNVPVQNPEILFDAPQFKRAGASFWPDGRPGLDENVWEAFGIPYRREPGFESGQILVNKQKCWPALRLAMWYTEHSDFCYPCALGDKATFHMAFRKLDIPYSMPRTFPIRLEGTTCQHDFQGRRIFQHRSELKWNVHGHNAPVSNFLFEDECLRFLQELRQKWSIVQRQSSGSGPLTRQLSCGEAPQGELRRVRRSSQIGPRLVLRAPFDDYTGYGQHAREVAKALKKSGLSFGILPLTKRAASTKQIEKDISDLFGTRFPACEWELLLHPANLATRQGVSTIYFTMWETTRLPEDYGLNIQQAKAVIVPCTWNASNFSAQGVDVPIYICPLGIDPAIFSFRSLRWDDTCVFGTAGNCSISGHSRKNLDDVIRAFTIAFPSETDVRLRVKAMPNDRVLAIRDQRIDVLCQRFTEPELVEWYASLTCFVSASRAEAWGLMQHQVMAVGRPVICCRYGGLQEFVDEDVGFCVDYDLEPARGRYAGHGLWARPSLQSLVEQMKHVYRDRDEAREKGLRSSARAHRLNWDNAHKKLLEILQHLKVI